MIELLEFEKTDDVDERLYVEETDDDTELLARLELEDVELGVGLTTDEELVRERLLLLEIETTELELESELVLELRAEDEEIVVAFPH